LVSKDKLKKKGIENKKSALDTLLRNVWTTQGHKNIRQNILTKREDPSRKKVKNGKFNFFQNIEFLP
jgi:hypothetical protein